MLIEFIIQDQFFSYTLKEFGQILGIPFKGQCSFFDKWSLDNLEFSVLTGGPYQMNPPFPEDIKLYVQEEWEGCVTRIHHDNVIDVEDNQILTREVVSIMKTWVEIIRENPYNLTYFISKRMEFVTKQAWLILPYGTLLTRLFKYVMFESPELSNDHYVLYDRVMNPLTAQQEQKNQKDYGTRRGLLSTSSSSAFGQPSSSHPNDDDNDGNKEGTSRASTPSPTRFVNLLTNDIR
ncbi:hypothetical protein Tco_1047638 [Tanacetum coccineum]